MIEKRFYAKVELNNIGRNVDVVRENIPDETMIMAIVKANAYGHGAVNVAHYLSGRVDWFGVATLDEAVELRENGVEEPILILGATMPYEFETAIKYGVTIAICDIERAAQLNSIAASLGEIADVHIKLDTGMSRIGFACNDDSIEHIKEINQMPNISVSGIFSHFAKADEADKSNALIQAELFSNFVATLEDNGVQIPIKHLSNSAGIMEMKSFFNMVRMGIMLYGLYPSDEMNKDYVLYPAMQLISHISFLKTVSAGTGISYGHTFIADKDMKVATVPVGYADGYPRCLSNNTDVIIKGYRCPVIGRICMDQMLVDVTALDSVSLGDEVVLVGSSGDESISVEELADKANSFNYEFVCGIGPRVPRAYFDNDVCVKITSYLINN